MGNLKCQTDKVMNQWFLRKIKSLVGGKHPLICGNSKALL